MLTLVFQLLIAACFLRLSSCSSVLKGIANALVLAPHVTHSTHTHIGHTSASDDIKSISGPPQNGQGSASIRFDCFIAHLPYAQVFALVFKVSVRQVACFLYVLAQCVFVCVNGYALQLCRQFRRWYIYYQWCLATVLGY